MRMHRVGVVGCIALLVLLACTTVPMAIGAGQATTVVSATVASATSLDTSGCLSAAATRLGPVPVGNWAIGGPCSIGFGSSNSGARLSMTQRDRTGTAMESIASNWTAISGSTNWFAATGYGAGVAWIGGAGGPGEPSNRFQYTDDGGVTWSDQASCDGSYPRDLQALSATLVYAVTGSSICMTTTGGFGPGAWTTVATGSFNRIFMVSPTLGYVAGTQGRVYKTVDGVNFDLIYDDPYFSNAPAVSATAGGTVILSGTLSTLPDSDFGVLVSTDAGASFTRTVLHTREGRDTSGVYGAMAVDDNVLLASTPYGRWRSIDAGATWATMPSAAWGGVPYERADGALFIPSGGDAIQRSDNDGATWITIQLGTGMSAHQRKVFGSGASELWSVGYSNRIVRSTDAGTTWESLAATRPTFNAVAAWSPSRWTVMGESGAAMTTSNAGGSFSNLDLSTTRGINDAIAMVDGTGVAVGDQVVRRTADEGGSWTAVSVPDPATIWYEVDRDDDGRLWAVGTAGRVMSSTDGGATWAAEVVVPGAPTLQALSVWADTIWVGGSAGSVWRSSTSGPLSWTAVPTGREGAVLGIWAIDALTAVVGTTYEGAVDSSYISRTADGGATWTSTQTAPDVRHLREFTTDDGRGLGYALTSGAYTVSADAGMTWSKPVGVGVGGYVSRLAPLNGGRVVAVGDSSMISRSAPRTSIPDGMAGSDSGFGACMETAAGTDSVSWPLAGAGNCSSSAPGNWVGIAVDGTAPTAVMAERAAAGTGIVDLRFGLRTSANQTSGDHAAVLSIEVVAP